MFISIPQTFLSHHIEKNRKSIKTGNGRKLKN